ncbi:unnamed protein product [Mycena citricolor]|uniref:Major facilitator superfamily (MFS) profile domain-containing protein n=1 Tax=Mycena citricolor TaxID=2018698 RepID=A0AAD2Q3K1_9AGAR|nr:unnamed protein product [Mycena citricolor]
MTPRFPAAHLALSSDSVRDDQSPSSAAMPSDSHKHDAISAPVNADATPSAPNAVPPQEKAKKRAKEDDEHILPHNNMPLVSFALMMTAFLAALDQTIVATALPTIVSDLQGGNNYSWVGSSYLIAAASFAPAYGKLSDIFGRKLVLYPCIAIFLFGSALCGAAKSMTWLIAARVIQGVGGGGIQQMVQVVIGDIVSLEERGTYGSYVGAMWGVAGVVGPLVGGALTDHVSWRWCFWINLPTGGVAGMMLFFFLNLNPHKGKTLREHVREFDFLGLVLVVGGVVALLLGFSESEKGWNTASTIAPLVVGLAAILAGMVNENLTNRSPIIPPRLFRTRTTSLIFLTVFLHSLSFFCAAFYLPLYFQILGASATKSGILIIPFALLSSVTSALAGYVVSKMGDYRRTRDTVTIIGYGLMIMLNEKSSLALQLIYPTIAGLGIGALFLPPLIAMQAAMPQKDMATSSTTFGLFRTLGATIGVSVGQVLCSGVVLHKLKKIPGLTLNLSGGVLAEGVRQIQTIQPQSMKQQVLHAYTAGISAIWILITPVLCICLIAVLFLKKYSLKRKIIRKDKDGREIVEPVAEATEGGPSISDIEKGALQIEEKTDHASTESDTPHL